MRRRRPRETLAASEPKRGRRPHRSDRRPHRPAQARLMRSTASGFPAIGAPVHHLSTDAPVTRSAAWELRRGRLERRDIGRGQQGAAMSPT